MADQSTPLSEAQPAESAAAITDLLEQIDAGEIVATPLQRAYLVGARDTITALAGSARGSASTA